MGAVAATLGGRLRLPIERFFSSEKGSLMKLDLLRSFSRPTRSSLSPGRCPRNVAVVAAVGATAMGGAAVGGAAVGGAGLGGAGVGETG